ncbi:hypothetical protein [Nocardiopsis synnemataformans]|uniref:hypothetical protein n=1 Tax=Nocardiopsis synnemataformans TaxID=61305 RepID=UPI003EBAB2B1
MSKRRKREQRETSLDRRRPHREERRVYLVVCETAPSTPTFETWLILHLRDHRSALVTAARAERELRALLPRWSKGATRFEDFAHGLEAAANAPSACRRRATPAHGFTS